MAKPRPTKAQLLQFVQHVARLSMDRECLTCGRKGDEESPSCDKHEPWEMGSDDAINTLSGVIENARVLVFEMVSCAKCGAQIEKSKALEDEGEGPEAGRTFYYDTEHCKETH